MLTSFSSEVRLGAHHYFSSFRTDFHPLNPTDFTHHTLFHPPPIIHKATTIPHTIIISLVLTTVLVLLAAPRIQKLKLKGSIITLKSGGHKK
jgi:hypothetical protein